MASPAYSTGVNGQAEELRRRNVPGQQLDPGYGRTAEKEKSKEKVHTLAPRLAIELATAQMILLGPS